MTARTKKAILTTGAIAGALVGVAGLVVPPVHFVDARYVHTDSFAIHQAGEAKRAAIDSLNYSRDMEEVRQTLTDIRADVLCLRHPKREACR
jgi:hypothetical protein